MIVQCNVRDTTREIVVNFPKGRLHVLQSLEASQRCCLPGFKLYAMIEQHWTFMCLQTHLLCIMVHNPRFTPCKGSILFAPNRAPRVHSATSTTSINIVCKIGNVALCRSHLACTLRKHAGRINSGCAWYGLQESHDVAAD